MGVIKHIEQLRDALLNVLSRGTWNHIKEQFAIVKLGWRPDLEPGSGKPKYVRKVLRDVDDLALIALGNRCVEYYGANNVAPIQDALWWIDADGKQEISEVTRRLLVERLEGRRLSPKDDLATFLSDAIGYSTGAQYGPGGKVYRAPWAFHIPGDSLVLSTYHDILKELGLFDWADRRVLMLCEALVRPEVRIGDEQNAWVAFLNECLEKDGYMLEPRERISGHSVFKAMRIKAGSHQRLKNVIFASDRHGFKPILGLSDALNNDIVTLENEETCIIYDQTVPDEGLSWVSLVQWWSEKQRIGNIAQARSDLGKRLFRAIASPPEKMLFETYFRNVKEVVGERLPALLPQVYVHYDPRIGPDRRGRTFVAQRMDFLLLLPQGVRVVLEVDGKQHYSEPRQIRKDDLVDELDPPKLRAELPSPRIYANTTRADRELRLRGYDVFRFGGYELRDEQGGRALLCEFFDELFKKHHV